MQTPQPHDIAMVKLPEKITFTSTIAPVCLPTKSAPVGADFEVAGWGKVDAKQATDQLKKVSMLERVNVGALALCFYSFSQAMMKVISPSSCENEPYKLVCLNQVHKINDI